MDIFKELEKLNDRVAGLTEAHNPKLRIQREYVASESAQSAMHEKEAPKDESPDLEAAGAEYEDRIGPDQMERFVEGLLTILSEMEIEGQIPEIETPEEARDALLAVVRRLYMKKSLIAKMSRKFARFGAKRFLRKQRATLNRVASK